MCACIHGYNCRSKQEARTSLTEKILSLRGDMKERQSAKEKDVAGRECSQIKALTPEWVRGNEGTARRPVSEGESGD